jgi:hypothetical protein
VNTAAFSPSGRQLVTASDDGTAVIRTCDVCGSVGDLLRLARVRIHGSLSPAEQAAYLTKP